MTDQIQVTKEWFEKCFPEKTDANKIVQYSVMLEEVLEGLVALGLPHMELAQTIKDIREGNYNDFLKFQFEKKEVREELLDSLADTYITIIGTAYNLDMDILGAISEVNRSNYSKLDKDGNPIYNEFGKIAKSELYSKPNLTPYL